MELAIEYSGEVGQGSFPDFLQFPDTQGQQFYVKAGKLYGKPSTKFEKGEFDSPVWLEENNVSPEGHNAITNFEIKTLTGFGTVGSFLNANNKQVMIIYEFQQDMSKYVNSGSIRFGIDTPIASFNITLENPVDKETEIDGNVAINEKTSLLSPGAKVIYSYSAGDDLEEVNLGSYYIDRSSFDVLSETVSADGRNLIGKALKDQTLNENFYTGYKSISEIINTMMENANLGIDDYEVEYNTEQRRYTFEPNKEVLSALEEIMKSLVDWKIEETTDGEIIVGSPSFNLFPSRGVYNFYRNKDIFSRKIARDDQGSYRKVCVHTQDWTTIIYKNVSVFSGWNLQSNKTLFVQVADGTSLANADAIAVEVAHRLDNVGKIESFDGPFRPQMMVGDEARIHDENGSAILGLITEISFNFGKSGFYTVFTVDSGGRLGRGRLSDFINMINNKGTSGSIAYEDIIPDPPVVP